MVDNEGNQKEGKRSEKLGIVRKGKRKKGR